ncbi:hypothetical protein BCR39DRAFT_232913 [Naematelia encephala]|uniref:Uncharacterized protein n=1 Tax=Naematelia encephala TaxID=71784 RepID=A0A1Y2BGS3_9TREE|nr:hypothetical protein BCR39DRAFT_232913 [Naematelia encephala]
MIAVRAFVVTTLIAVASAHIALWDEGMYGWTDDPNQNNLVTPLANLTFSEWWFHGQIDSPPPDGKVMNLPSGGTYHGQVACNKALTTYGQNPAQQTGLYACDGTGPQGGIGAMHTSDAWESPDPKDVKGCGIAIAYESDVSKIKPEDFAVISVNYTCPWFKHVDFEIPSDLPACPEGGCHCMWGWIHSADSGSEQMYFVGYRCNVTGATGTTPIPQTKTANKCDYPTDTSNCTIGAKSPHYWLQAEGNNNFQGTYDPPFYNGAYGYMNGAQTDLFAGESYTMSTETPSTSSSVALLSASSSPVSNTVSSSQPLAATLTGSPTLTTSAVLSSLSDAAALASPQTSSTSSTFPPSLSSSNDPALPNATVAANSTVSPPGSNVTSATASASSNLTKQCKRRRSPSARALQHLASHPEYIKRHDDLNLRLRRKRTNKAQKRGIEPNLTMRKRRSRQASSRLSFDRHTGPRGD